MNLTDLREAVATVLDGLPEVVAGDWTVHPTAPDALAPPAFLLRWGPDPWREGADACADMAALEVVAVVPRLTPEGENTPTLETMVDAAIVELASARLRPYRALSPAPLDFARVTYTAARLQIRRPVTIESR